MLRRNFVPLLALPLLRAATHSIRLNAGTYGMRSLSIADALRAIADIGYDGVEIALMPGWPTNPAVLSAADRQEIRRILNGTGLALASLMESLSMDSTAKNQAVHAERLKRAMALAHDLSPNRLPVIETVLGGKSAAWAQVKDGMAEELAQWAKLAEEGGVTICFKAHVDQAADIPDRALWLLQRVTSPRIRVIYDYSHFYLQGLTLEASLRSLFPYTAYIAVKDSAGDRNQHHFLLPGEGTTDYAAYLRLLQDLGYNGFVGVEISSQIHSKPGYEPVATAKLCYERLAKAFQAAGVRRPSRS